MHKMPEILEYLQKFVPQNNDRRFSAQMGLDRAAYLLKLLDNPQDKVKVIHIAGTSGKGSTAYLCSLMLESLGLKVGLNISPHISDIRERFQINNNLISEDKFSQHFKAIKSKIEKMSNSKFGAPTYFEIINALAFYIFYKEKVDYAVIETGLGGLCDASNTINSKNKVVILTRIGFDHMEILGNTLKEIAFQKASIIKEDNLVISCYQNLSIRKVIDAIAHKQKAKVSYISSNKEYSHIRVNHKYTIFDYKFNGFELNDIKCSLLGAYQAENLSLALTAVILLSKRDNFDLNLSKLRKSLINAEFFGRMSEMHIKNKTIILDGAHNYQKMHAFLSTLKTIYKNEKFNFIIAFKQRNDYGGILKEIRNMANNIIVTEFNSKNRDVLIKNTTAISIRAKLTSMNFNKLIVEENPIKALEKQLQSSDNHKIIVTGSFYLLSNLYDYLADSAKRNNDSLLTQ